MPMELRKRKAAAPPPAPTGKKPSKAAKIVSEAKAKVKETAAAVTSTANGSSGSSKPAVGDTITLDGFGGEVETHDGTKTTLKALVDASKAGVVLFTYPKASTPGCTRQACLFRDNHTTFTSSSGLAIYGLSTDSPKANTTFATKQSLPYPLLCDPSATLIAAIGLKKQPKGTTRGVFVVDKTGKVLASQAGGPEGTVEVVRGVVEGLEGKEGNGEVVKPGVEERKGEEEEKVAVEEKMEEEKVAAAAAEPAAAVEAEKVNGAEKKEEPEKEAAA